MTATIDTIPSVPEIRDAAHQAGATTTHVLDAIAWVAASEAADYVTKDWMARLRRANEVVRNTAHTRIAEDAAFWRFDLDSGYTFDEVPPIFASHVTMAALVSATSWVHNLDLMIG